MSFAQLNATKAARAQRWANAYRDGLVFRDYSRPGVVLVACPDIATAKLYAERLTPSLFRHVCHGPAYDGQAPTVPATI